MKEKTGLGRVGLLGGPMGNRVLGMIASAAAMGLVTSSLYAHPLGMSSINRYAGLRVVEDEIEVDYLLDLAELPAYAEIESLDTNHDNAIVPSERDAYLDALLARIAPAMKLVVNGSAVEMRPVFRSLTAPAGQNGMSTLRVAVEFRAAQPAGYADVTLSFTDHAFANRRGWRELEATDSPYATVARSSQPRAGRHAGPGLVYPSNAAASLRREDTLTATFVRTAGPSASHDSRSVASGTTPSDSQSATLVAMVRRADWSLSLLLFAFVVAFALGAGHALTPGHGKTLVASYLMGKSCRVQDALILGVSVTATHTASVFVLGLGALVIERTIGTDSITHALGVASGALVALIALGQLPGRIRHLLDPHRPATAGSAEVSGDETRRAHGPDAVAHHHGDGRVHTHGTTGHSGDRHALVVLGISGGIMPCPGALVVLLTALSVHRLILGLGLLVAFSFGLAATLSSLAVLFVLAKQRFDRVVLDGKMTRTLPVVSSVVVLVLGLGIILQSLLR